MAKPPRKTVGRRKTAKQVDSAPEPVNQIVPTVGVADSDERRSTVPAADEDSIIMLSSAENTLLNSSEPSLILREPRISLIDLARPSTRLSNVDMTLEITGRTFLRCSAPDMEIENTNLSLSNIIQTPGVHRDRPKSSVVPRRTSRRSFVLPPVPLFDEEITEFVVPSGDRQSRTRTVHSEEFSLVTKRRAKSGRPVTEQRPPLENIVEDTAQQAQPQLVTSPEVLVPVVESQTRKPTVKRKRGRPKKQLPVEDPRSARVVEAPQISRVSSRKGARSEQHIEPESQNISVVTTQLSKASNRRNAMKVVENDKSENEFSGTQRNSGDENISVPANFSAPTDTSTKNVRTEPVVQCIVLRTPQNIRNHAQNDDILENNIPNESEKDMTPQISKVTKRRHARNQQKDQNLTNHDDPQIYEDNTGKQFDSNNEGSQLQNELTVPNEGIAPEDNDQNKIEGPIIDTPQVSKISNRRHARERANIDSEKDSDKQTDTETPQISKISSRRQIRKDKKVNESDKIIVGKDVETPQISKVFTRRRRNVRVDQDLVRDEEQISAEVIQKDVDEVSSIREKNLNEGVEAVPKKTPQISKVSTRRRVFREPGNNRIPGAADNTNVLSASKRRREENNDFDKSLEGTVVTTWKRTRLDSNQNQTVESDSKITQSESKPSRGRPRTRTVSREREQPARTRRAINSKARCPCCVEKKKLGSESGRNSQEDSTRKSLPKSASSPEPRARRGRSKSVVRGPSSKPNKAIREVKIPEPERRRSRSHSVIREPTVPSLKSVDLEDTKNEANTGHTVRRGRIKSVAREPKAPLSKNNKLKLLDSDSDERKKSRKRTVSCVELVEPAAPNPESYRIRSRSVVRETNVPSCEPGLFPRNRSISRGPSAEHIPIYRKFAEEVPKPAKRAKHSPKKTAAPVDDIYAFDLSDVTSEKETDTNGSRGRKRARNNTKPKRAPRSASACSGRQKITPVKKAQLTLFGTDMHRINSVVKKIGGGPVRRQDNTGITNVTTSTLMSLVQQQPPKATVSIDRDIPPRSVSTLSNYHDHQFADDQSEYGDENTETLPEPPPPPAPQVNKLLERVQQRNDPPAGTPNRAQREEPNATLAFSPLGASSPWRIQNENVLPKTFYFSRSKDLLPSYESDMVVQHDENQAPDPVPKVPEPTVSPKKVSPISTAKADAVFQGIQKSYDQLKVTSEMSEKLITAMRKYKTSIASNQTFDELPENERLIAKFREYEKNMKRTYEKLRQWYERSQQTLTHSMRAIQQLSDAPKTASQAEVLENFRRESHAFTTMVNELENAMNDSNIENISPPKTKTAEPKDRLPFKDIILTDRDMANRNRSPLKTLDIANVPPPSSFSLIKSPLAKATFSNKSNSRLSLTKPPAIVSRQPPITEPSVIEIADTFHANASERLPAVEKRIPGKDLFGFEEDSDGGDAPIEPTPMKITRDTLKERLQSVRKMLPPRPPSRTAVTSTIKKGGPRREYHGPRIFGSPSKTRSATSAFTSTPFAKNPPGSTGAHQGQREEDHDISAIDGAEPETVPSPVVDLFEELKNGSLNGSAVNRTYSRLPRRNPKRKRNIYLAYLDLSSDEDDEVEPDLEEAVAETGNKKRRRVVPSKKTVEQTHEFNKFVNEFNSMCEEVNRYQLVIDKPPNVRQRV